MDGFDWMKNMGLRVLCYIYHGKRVMVIYRWSETYYY